MNKTGFEAFFKEKYSQAYFLALRILHDDEASKDVVADAFELVWRRTQQEKIENISAYLMMSVRNVCLDYIRKQNVRSHYVQASVQATEQTIHNPDYWGGRARGEDTGNYGKSRRADSANTADIEALLCRTQEIS